MAKEEFTFEWWMSKKRTEKCKGAGTGKSKANSKHPPESFLRKPLTLIMLRAFEDRNMKQPQGDKRDTNIKLKQEARGLWKAYLRADKVWELKLLHSSNFQAERASSWEELLHGVPHHHSKAGKNATKCPFYLSVGPPTHFQPWVWVLSMLNLMHIYS